MIIDLSRSNAFLIKLVSFHFLFLRFLLREFGSTNEQNEQSILTEIDFFLVYFDLYCALESFLR